MLICVNHVCINSGIFWDVLELILGVLKVLQWHTHFCFC